MSFRQPHVAFKTFPCKPPSSFPATFAPAIVRPSASRHHRRHLPACIGLAALVLIGCPPADAQPAEARPAAPRSSYASLTSFIAEASQRFGIPAAWIRAVMHVESLGDVRAISPKGAMGLMQIMPETWASLRQRYRLGADPYDAHDNILAGAAYLRELHDRYGIPGFLAAYNAGPARWEDHLATGRPLPAETRAYLTRLASIAGGDAADDTALLPSIVRSWTEAPLFPVRLPSISDNMTGVARSPEENTPHASSAKDWTGLAPRSDGLFVASSSAGRSQ